MTDYKAAEVEAAIEAAYPHLGWESLAGKLGYENSHPTLTEVTLRGETVPVEKVAEDEGGQNAYDTFIIVKAGTQLFRKEGHYRSHYGDDWDGDFTEVEAVLMHVTSYRAK